MKFIDNTDKTVKALSKAIEDSLEEIGIVGTANAQSATPVDTGKLKRSISYKVNTKTDGVMVGTNVNYAIPVHEGSSKMKARPFIRDGLNETVKEIIPILKNNFKKNMG